MRGIYLLKEITSYCKLTLSCNTHYNDRPGNFGMKLLF